MARNKILPGLAILGVFALNNGFAKTDQLTRDNGAPVGDNQNSQTAGPDGPSLLQDSQLVEKLARFDRERIPERVVHARGTGAHGFFVSNGNYSDLTENTVLAKKGKKTPVFVRFSTVIHSKGSPETLRDPHGFAVKFYSDQGNWDIVGNNLPVFFIRDAIKFPDMIHSLKPDPVTNVQEPERFFDFFSRVPESTNMLTLVYSDLGTPLGYRFMDGNGVHAFKFVNKKNEVKYVKLHWISKQGIKNLHGKELMETQAKDFNHLTNDLYGAINKGDFPKWDLEVQVLDPKDLNKFDFNPLDTTKEWTSIPNLKKMIVGTMTLNKVPENFFQDTELSAFSPNNMIPGVEASEDRMLQGRLFSYPDTQRHRIGGNFNDLEINRPLVAQKNYNQDGVMSMRKQTGSINYQPNSFDGDRSRQTGTYADNPAYKSVRTTLSGTTQQEMIAKTQNFKQAGDNYRAMSDKDKGNLIENLSGDLNKVKTEKIKIEMIAHFYAADADYGTRLAKSTNVDLAAVKKSASTLKE